MSSVYFTSDTHFSHKNIVLGTSTWSEKSGCRPFQTVEEHDETILTNINDMVKEDDILYHLGDFVFGKNKGTSLIELKKKLRCKLVNGCRGNHDLPLDDIRRVYPQIYDYLEVKMKGRFIVLCHYPIISWNHQSRGSYMLHGHCHSTLKNPKGRMLDVGLEGHDYKPWHIDEIVEKLDKIDPFAVDHHVEKGS